MEIVRQVLDLLGDIVQALIDGLAQLILALSGSVVDMTEAEAQTIATALLGLVLFAWVARRTIWSNGLGMFRPMTITLQTTRTPWQVLMGDIRTCFVTALALVVFAVFIVAVIAGR
jgi:hypothetical protein